MEADLLLFNGRVYTMDVSRPLASAVAVAGDRIMAVGNDEELLALLPPAGLGLDLDGRAVIPGLIDAHVHFGWYGIGLVRGHIDLDNVPSKEEAIGRVAAAARRVPPGRWIQGGGWNKNIWPGSPFPSAADLDAVTPEHPVALEDKSHHATWVNTQALVAAGITADTPDPPGGEILRDGAGRPRGVLLETASELVHSVIPEPDVNTAVEGLRLATAEAQSLGLTGIHDPGHSTVLSAYQVLRNQGKLGLRALVHIPDDDLAAAEAMGLRSGFGDEYLRLGGVKIFADGALGPQTAHMLSPYEGSADKLGIPTHSEDELVDLVRRAYEAGLSVAVHAIGDAANRAVLNAIEQARSLAAGVRQLAHPALPDRTEHVQLLHPDDLTRFSQLQVVASMQPVHATSDMWMAERHWGDRCQLSYAWSGLLEHGACLAFGSDCPIETLDPLAGIHAAATRRRVDGSPGPDGWIPAQRVSVNQAVQAYTLGAAHASGEASLKGSLVAGKFADVVVLTQDIFRIDPMEIANTRVAMTVFDGQVVYARDL